MSKDRCEHCPKLDGIAIPGVIDGMISCSRCGREVGHIVTFPGPGIKTGDTDELASTLAWRVRVDVFDKDGSLYYKDDGLNPELLSVSHRNLGIAKVCDLMRENDMSTRQYSPLDGGFVAGAFYVIRIEYSWPWTSGSFLLDMTLPKVS